MVTCHHGHIDQNLIHCIVETKSQYCKLQQNVNSCFQQWEFKKSKHDENVVRNEDNWCSVDMLHVPSSSDHVYCNGGSAVLQSALIWFRTCKISVLSEAGDIVPVRPLMQQLCSLYSFLDAQIAPTWADTYWQHSHNGGGTCYPLQLTGTTICSTKETFIQVKYCEYEHSIQHRSWTAEGIGRSCSINAHCTCVWLKERCPTAAWGLSEISWTCDQAPPAASFTRWLPRTRL